MSHTDFTRGVEAAPKHRSTCCDDACRGECLWPSCPRCLECDCDGGRIDPSQTPPPAPDLAAVEEAEVDAAIDRRWPTKFTSMADMRQRVHEIVADVIATLRAEAAPPVVASEET